MACGKHRRWHFQDPKFKNFLGVLPLDPPRYGAPLALLFFFLCIHLQNLTLCPWCPVSYRLWNQCPIEGRSEKQIIWKLGLEGGWGGGGILNIVIAKDGSIFIWNYFRGLKFWCATLFWKPLPPLGSNKRLFPKARFKRRTLHVPNLIIRFSTCKVWGMNQLGTALLYLGRLCCSIRLSLSNRMAKDQLWFIHRTSHVLNVMHKLSIINYVLFNITTLADRTHRSVTTVTSIHVVDFYTETGRLKTVF